MCGVAYIPPIRTKYAHPDPYLELQTDINKFDNYNMLLFGDFNTRDADMPDSMEAKN